MSSPIAVLWALLSLMVAGMGTFSFMQPFWLLEPRRPNCFGVYSYCVSDERYQISNSKGGDRQLCGIYGGQFSLNNLPSRAWLACCVLFGGGCLLHTMCSALAICALCLRTRRRWDQRLASITGIFQAVAVMLSVGGLIVFPAGFGSPFVMHYCKTSESFRLGKCELGWGYLLAIMACALSLFCPILAQFFDVKLCPRPDSQLLQDGAAEPLCYHSTPQSHRHSHHRHRQRQQNPLYRTHLQESLGSRTDSGSGFSSSQQGFSMIGSTNATNIPGRFASTTYLPGESIEPSDHLDPMMECYVDYHASGGVRVPLGGSIHDYYHVHTSSSVSCRDDEPPDYRTVVPAQYTFI